MTHERACLRVASEADHSAPSSRPTTVPAVVLLAAIAAVALNLRPFITGIGPLARDIGAQTGLNLIGLSL